MEEGLKIVSLQAENVKRLRAVRVTPEGSLVVISGANGAGKSSVLDSIEMALGGKSAIPDEPIHRGKRKARTVVDLGEIVVERTFTPSGSKLTVKDRDGKAVKSPQGLLDQLVSRISFDPLEFATMAPGEQDRVLRELVGVDFGELDADRKALYEERADVNREAKRIAARVQALPPMAAGVPEDEVSMSDLLQELAAAEEQAGLHEKLSHDSRLAWARSEDLSREANNLEASIAEWERLIVEAKAKLPTLREEGRAAEEESARLQCEADAIPCDLAEGVRERMGTVEETNRKVRANRERAESQKDLDAAEAKSRELTEAIEEIDRQKAETLEKAEYPIPGLGLDEGGVLLDGLPFDQACTSAKIRASIAIGAALNPKLRVLLVRRGNDLDRERLREVAQMAEEMGLQVWCERIESGGLPAVVIEDGEVVEQEDTAAAE